jgi:hypothetical protein
MSGFGSMQNAVAEWGIFVLDKMIGGFSWWVIGGFSWWMMTLKNNAWWMIGGFENDDEKFEHQKLNT